MVRLGSRGRFLALIVIFLQILAILTFADSTPTLCIDMPPTVIDMEDTMFLIEGPIIYAYPKIDGKTRGDLFIKWDFSFVMERLPVSKSLSGEDISPENRIVIPQLNKFVEHFVGELDPFQNSTIECQDDGKDFACSPLLSYVNISTMYCSIENFNDSYHGYPRHTWRVNVTDAASSFHAELYYYVVNESFVIPKNLTLDNYQVFETYLRNSLKLSYILHDYPWAQSEESITYWEYNNKSYTSASAASIWVALDFHLGIPTKINLTKAGEVIHLTFDGTDVPFSLYAQIMEFYEADGNRSWLGLQGSRPQVILDISPSWNTTAWVTCRLEHGRLGHWNTLVFDPNLGSLFSAPVATKPLPTLAKGFPAWAGVVIAVVCVAIIAVVVLLAFIFAPAARTFISPFWKRKAKGYNTHNLDDNRDGRGAKASTWTQAKAPRE